MPPRDILPGPSSRRRIMAGRHSRNPKHLERCVECRAALGRERQYLERLRDAAVPEASQDLTARLLQHTPRLANEHAPEWSKQREPAGLTWRGLRVAGVAAGTLVVSAGALAVSAYTVAGDGVPGERLAGSDVASAFIGGPAQLMSAPVPGTGQTVALSPGQLDSLREQGWACPELSGLGFHVTSAEAIVHDGHPAVELTLESNGHHATVLEEHVPGAGQSTPAQLSVTQGTPWGAVYRTPAGVLSYSSDLPAEEADDAVPELVKAADAMVATQAVQPSEKWSERLLRGLRTLLRPAGL